MSAPLKKVSANEIKIPVPNIRDLIDSCRIRKYTGVIRISSDGEKSLYLLYKNGIVVNSYIFSSEEWKSVSPETWKVWIDSTGAAYTRFIQLSVQGLITFKLLIQSCTGKTQTFASQVRLTEYLETQKNTPVTALVQLEWERAMGAVLLTGPSGTPSSLFISPENLQDQTGIAPSILAPDYANCTVTVFDADRSVEAWQEYLLRRAFADICERTLARFQVVTGRALVESLIRLILAFASRQDLEIGIIARKVEDGECFSSPKQAADAYRLLLTEMFVHFSGITGSRLLSSTLREIDASLPIQEREVVKEFSLFTEGYIYDRRN
jgi:hypothetical protein